MIEEVIANIEDYSLWDYKGYKICKEEAEAIVEGLKELKAYREEDAIAKEKAKFKKELKELVAQKLEEINHYISGVDTPFLYVQVRETQENLLDISNILGIEGAEYDT